MNETRREKRNRVIRALEHPELGRLSSRQLARELGLNRCFIDRVRSVFFASGAKNETRQRVGSDGRQFSPRKPRGKAPPYGRIAKQVLLTYLRQQNRRYSSMDEAIRDGHLDMEHWLVLIEQARHEFYAVTGEVSEVSRKRQPLDMALLFERVRHQVRRHVLKEALKKNAP